MLSTPSWCTVDRKCLSNGTTVHFFKVSGFARGVIDSTQSKLEGKPSKAEAIGFSSVITDICHCLGEGWERKARLFPPWFRSQHLAATSQDNVDLGSSRIA